MSKRNQLNLRIDDETMVALEELRDKGIETSNFIRALLKAGIACYKEEGEMRFPLSVVPTSELNRLRGIWNEDHEG